MNKMYKPYNKSFLFPKVSFWYGFLNALNIWGSLDEHKYYNKSISDEESIKLDWEKVGSDFSKAIDFVVSDISIPNIKASEVIKEISKYKKIIGQVEK